MNELTIRKALQTRLATIAGLNAYPRPETQITLPAALVGYPEPMTYGETMVGTRGSAVFPIRLLVSHLGGDVAEQTLAAMLDASLSTSVPAVIEASTTFNARVIETRDYGIATINGDQVTLSVDLLVEVYA